MPKEHPQGVDAAVLLFGGICHAGGEQETCRPQVLLQPGLESRGHHRKELTDPLVNVSG